jgi:hypothetical protein
MVTAQMTAPISGISQRMRRAVCLASSSSPAPIWLPMMMPVALEKPREKTVSSCTMVLEICTAASAAVPSWP